MLQVPTAHAHGPLSKGSFKVADTAWAQLPTCTRDDPNRRDFIHIAATAAALGAVGGLAWPLVDQMNPAGDTLAWRRSSSTWARSRWASRWW
jgi:ubiquinol-cytochrome c reductase iron-sulfur subunit